MFELRSATDGGSASPPEVPEYRTVRSSAELDTALEDWLRETSVAFTLGG